MPERHESTWFVSPWTRYAGEYPIESGPTGATVTIHGEVHDVVRRAPQSWLDAHIREGATVTDHARGITYRATVNPQRPGELDYLEVVIEGHVPEGGFRKVPVSRIRDAVVQFLAGQAAAKAESGEDTLFLIRPGGVTTTDPSLKPPPPPSAEVARHLSEGLKRADIAKLYRRPVRTVDGWIHRARKEHPTSTPAPTRGRRTDKKGER